MKAPRSVLPLFPSIFPLLFTAVAVAGVICALSCNTTEPPPPRTTSLHLRVEDASCIEVWIKATTTDVPATVALLRDGNRVTVSQILSSDTLLVDEGLSPNTPYSYRLQRLGSDSTVVETSTEVQVTTMDTTSHNWSFQIDTLGVTSSVLYDVAVISEDNIWAVGELFLNDSSGQLDPILYNAAHWDGTQWNIVRISYIYQGSSTYSSIKTLFAFSEDDIWFSNSTHWNGQQFHNVNLAISVFYGVSINKMWGSPNGELYVVGNSGTIAYSSDHGGTWQRVESGTILPINDVFGMANSHGGNQQVLCVASDQFVNRGKRLLSLNGLTALNRPDSGLSWALNTIWFIPDRKYIIGGDGLYVSNTLGPVWFRDTLFPPHYKTSVRGNGVNDMILVGAFGLCMHFNGLTWQSYHDATYMSSGAFGRVEVKGKLIVAVGGVDNKAAVLIGRQ